MTDLEEVPESPRLPVQVAPALYTHHGTIGAVAHVDHQQRLVFTSEGRVYRYNLITRQVGAQSEIVLTQLAIAIVPLEGKR
jgi:hypothetical protein